MLLWDYHVRLTKDPVRRSEVDKIYFLSIIFLSIISLNTEALSRKVAVQSDINSEEISEDSGLLLSSRQLSKVIYLRFCRVLEKNLKIRFIKLQ